MSINLISQVSKNQQYKGSKKLVLLTIAILTNDNKGHAWPSLKELSQRCGLGERFIQRCLAALKADGAIDIVLRSGKSSEYVIREDWLCPSAALEDDRHLKKGLSFLKPGSIAYESSRGHRNGKIR